MNEFAAVFEPSYFELRRFVRVGGFESDLHVLAPGEFGAYTSELVQLLRKGHYGVELDREAWSRLYTWIDLNAPCHGTWRETIGPQTAASHDRRRRELRALYDGITIPNAMCFSPDRRHAYYSDTTTQKIMRQRLEADRGW